MKRSFACLLLALALCAPLRAQGFLKGKILYFDAGDHLSERSGSSFQFSLSGGLSVNSTLSLLSVERALEKAAEDKDIAMVFLRPDQISAGMAAREELRQSLARFAAKGKPVVCYGVSFTTASYYLGSVGDRVFMHPGSSGTLNGPASTQLYYKDLLDSLGIRIQLIRHGSYKSAGEPYVRSEMSEENRRQYQALLGSVWTPMVEEMAASRGVAADSLRACVSTLRLSTSRDWLDKGLVDGLKYRDEMEDYLCHLFGKADPDDLKKVSMSDYVESLKDSGSKKVAVLYAEGEIVRSGSGIAGEKFAREIAKVRADSTVKAVVFRVNSPGGEVVAAEMIRREVESLRKVKPVIASYGDYAASGGYWISAGTDRIFVDNATLTGSIGVFGQVVSYGEALEGKLHIHPYTVGTHEHSDMGSGIRPLDERELARYQEDIDGIYDDFVRVVSDGRGMDRDAVDALAQGRVWSGGDALKIGLADEKGLLLDAVRYAAKRAGLEKYGIVAYPAKNDLLGELLSLAKDENPPMIHLRDVLPAGYSVIARMPYVKLDQN
ncbi:MAG: signal peptide peptidase SppA [Bacteroidales bacterium]|nr:signal peptide peptidase SppA [Bacteroidales bacterium]